MIYQIYYVSVSQSVIQPSDIYELVQLSKEHNEASGTKGFFVPLELNFGQITEGPRRVVEQLYAKISEDHRLRDLIIIKSGETHERVCSQWFIRRVGSHNFNLLSDRLLNNI